MNQTDYSKKILTIPNVLSFFRLALVPLVVYLYIVEKSNQAVLYVLILSAVTDLADGYIARRFHMISELGKILDPVADKLTQASILLCLTAKFHRMLIPFVLMFLKETIMSVSGFQVMKHTGKVYGAEWHGKLNTTLMFFMYISHLIWADMPAVYSDWIISIVSVSMLVSCVLYSIRNYRLCIGYNNVSEIRQMEEEISEK